MIRHPVSYDNFPALAQYQITHQLSESCRSRVFRAVRDQDGLSVILKLPTSDRPPPQDLLRFRNHYQITHHLDLLGVVRPLALEPYQNGLLLVMPDDGSVCLREYIYHHPLSAVESVAIAIQVTDILYDLHQHHIIHKDLKPDNLLIHPKSKHITLIDFCIASQLPRETESLKHPNVIEGTLAYLAPEQTGRINRGIDYRTDFYALGVTLFELLTGQLPFQSDDSLELLHFHLAKPAPCVSAINPDLPASLGEIVLKLMAKNAEDRYQSALGLKYDLEQVLSQLKTPGSQAPFSLGSHDHSDRFLIPEKLFGRDQAVKDLLQAFDRIASAGQPEHQELVLVGGASGIGKTAVIHEVHRPLLKHRGYFIQGKYDQVQRNIPFSAFVQAFRNLMAHLLAESDAQVQVWKSKILDAVGDNGQALIEVIPELEHILGPQPALAEISGSATQNRFQVLMQRFVQVFTGSGQPLVLFLDDLQWADLESLKLLQLLMQGTGQLLIIGAYRNNEVSPGHPFMMKVEEIRNAGSVVNTIELQPLKFQDIHQLVAETLHGSLTDAHPLAEWIHQKTDGNPFFATQFLKTLFEENRIWFDARIHRWQYDIAQVSALAVADNVIELMVNQLQKLPSDTQSVLKLAACIGTVFALDMLSVIVERDEAETASLLWPALNSGLILPVAQTSQYSGQTKDGPFLRSSRTATYGFLHDRVQQAAYSLIPDSEKQATHLKIGQLLLQNDAAIEHSEHLFEMVNHLNVGRHLITEALRQEQLIELNFLAAQKAKTSTAYQSASQYLQVCLEQLPDSHWQTQPDQTRLMYELAAELAYLNADYDRMNAAAILCLAHTATPIEKIRIYEIKMMGAKAQGQHRESIQIGLELLAMLGIHFPVHPTEDDIETALTQTSHLWRDRSIGQLIDLPIMTDPVHLAGMRILTQMIAPSYQSYPILMPLLIFKQIELSILQGNCEVSTYAYADYGLVLCGIVNDVDAGYQFGQLALELLNRFQTKLFRCRAYFIVHSYISHWQKPLRNSLPFFQEGYEIGLESGDPENGALNAQMYCANAYFAGIPLKKLATELDAYRQGLLQLKQETALNFQAVFHQTVLNLMGLSPAPCHLDGVICTETEILETLNRLGLRSGLFYFYFNKTALFYLFEQYEQAQDYAVLAHSYADSMTGMFAIPLLCFFSALIEVQRYETLPKPEQAQALERLAHAQEQLRQWADQAPTNHLHRFELVQAEHQRLLGDKAAAIEAYDRAIRYARAHQYLQDQALANELAAKFYLTWNKEGLAQSYLLEAHRCYRRWEARAKVEDLTQRYSSLLTSVAPPLDTVDGTQSPAVGLDYHQISNEISSTAVSEAIDLATILKASQSLSREIELDSLLTTLLQVVIQNAGADKCALLMPKGESWVIEAFSHLEQPSLLLQSLSIEDHQYVPTSVINVVKRTHQPIVIEVVDKDRRIASDPYLVHHRPQSILCFPLLSQGQLMGLLYLENNLTAGAFTLDRVSILEMICSQAAISLRNARLYAQMKESEIRLEQQVRERTQALQIANQELARLANVDSLTQIANRRCFDEYLESEWQRHLRHQLYLGLILIDIDYFKRYNDTHGHPAGDACLIQVVRALTPVVKRSTDLLARYGGEEFVAILPHTSIHGVQRVAELMLQAIADLALPHTSSPIRPYVTISLGLTSVLPTHTTSLEDLISQADQALYQAKQQGRNQAVSWVQLAQQAKENYGNSHSSLRDGLQRKTR